MYKRQDLSNTQILGSHVTATLGNSVYLGSNSAYVVSGATTKGMDVYNSNEMCIRDSYYTNYIKGRSDWEFAGMYTDEGISATNTLHREGLKSMIRDAMDGRIDLIITKSVSRFARNKMCIRDSCDAFC